MLNIQTSHQHHQPRRTLVRRETTSWLWGDVRQETFVISAYVYDESDVGQLYAALAEVGCEIRHLQKRPVMLALTGTTAIEVYLEVDAAFDVSALEERFMEICEDFQIERRAW